MPFKNKYMWTAIVMLSFFFVVGRSYAQAPVISYTPRNRTLTAGVSISFSPTNTGGATSTGQTTTLAGTGSAGSTDGVGTAASFNQPLGATVDPSGNIYIAEGGTHIIRKITPNGTVSLFAGRYYTGDADGQGTSAAFWHPVGLAADQVGNIYVADEDNNKIKKITPFGMVTTFAGSGSQGGANGTGAAASFYYPCGVAVDASGNVYVADTFNNKIRKITPAGVVSDLAGSGSAGTADGQGAAAAFSQPFSIVVDASGNLFVTDRVNARIRKITPSGFVSTLAGSTSGYLDGTGAAAKFNAPTGLAIDKQGNLFVTDEANNRIRKITAAGVVTTVAGTGTAGANNGAGNVATFNLPFGLAVDGSGFLYVGDFTTNLIRKVVSSAFTISPSLSPGLAFDGSNGAISGTPTASAPTNYTVTAYNAYGTGAAPLSITVVNNGAPSPSADMNYIATMVPKLAGITTNDALYAISNDVTMVETNIEYLDDLGRPIQEVQVKGSPSQRDIIQPIAYDGYGRETIKYLPYPVKPTATSDGRYNATAISDQASFYANPSSATWNAPGVASTNFPTSETKIETSPLDRPLEQGAPGDNWQLTGKSGTTNAGHTTKFAYATNNASGVSSGTGFWAKLYGVDYPAPGQFKTALKDLGGYQLNQLFVTVTKNENWLPSQTNQKWNTTEEYQDKAGKVVLRRVFNHNDNTNQDEILSTYYVYDDYSNLTYVLPPNADPDAGNITQDKLDAFCYQYRYDGRNRMVEKKIPGQGWLLMLYNKMDQLVGLQDSVQRMKNPQEWNFVKYDGFQRTVISGFYTLPGSTVGVDYRAQQQALVDAQTSEWETKLPGADYTTRTYPTIGFSTLSANYFDNYDIPGRPGIYTPSSYNKMTRGLPTGSKVALLTSSLPLLLKTQYYDQNWNIGQNYVQHFKGANVTIRNYDSFDNTYDFLRQQTNSVRNHYIYVSGQTNAVIKYNIAKESIYDHVGRQKESWQQITNQDGTSAPVSDTKVQLSKLDYNEIGQLLTKHLHSTNGTSYLQDVGFQYNERGWLLKSTAPLFEEQLQYNVVNGISGISPTAQYNGNIASQSWGTASAQNVNSYTYSYDKLNRLISGTSTEGNTEIAAYDRMGNIRALNRYNTGGVLVDQLTYNYTVGSSNTNILQTITDGTLNDSGVKHGTSNYNYDGNGNMLVDQSRISGTVNFSYNRLNLPQNVTGAKTITYTYDASGQKLRRVSAATSNTDYVAGIQYDGATSALSFIRNDEGESLPIDAVSYNYEYYLFDHLGNIRVSFDSRTGVARKVQEDNYYPYGQEINYSVSGTKNEYLYNKKELEEEIGDYDYGARFYDPLVARWTSIDPMSESGHQFSPYSYVEGNPMGNTDPNGMETDIGTGWSLEKLQEIFGSNSVQIGYLESEQATSSSKPPGTDKSPNAQRTRGYWRTLWDDMSNYDDATSITQNWNRIIDKPQTALLYAGDAYYNAIQVFTTDFWVNQYHGMVNYFNAPAEVRAKIDSRGLHGQIVGFGTFAPISEFASFKNTPFVDVGPTFSEYKASRGGTKTLAKIKVEEGYQLISDEFHHAFITQRMQKAYNIPNYFVNNRFNVIKLNTVQHALIDPYRYQFLRASFKPRLGLFTGEYNWFTKFK
ncbi:DUF6443 domain-containing protein [Mucilaginibacter sp. SJ]|uniref:DUF6443 domain-containing protein n=1 Tax=Mucilaginibacter sp. SJ TaxID=3029053 RepID=UPI0023A94FF7|nr:DUF6443 domain-containing protein [Mucilaginibacter sp. SJ]WEA03845.1 DUF6443 domain-containing protein [Mucilaginibacter sp. SJ]